MKNLKCVDTGSTTRGVIDVDDCVFGSLAGHPDDPTWMPSVRGAEEAITEAKGKLVFARGRTGAAITKP